MVIKFVFFDIGGTLGDRDAGSGKLVPYASTARLMSDIRNVMGLPMGVITTLGQLSNHEGLKLLADAGLDTFLHPHGLISEHDVQEKGKPRAAIYQFAADKVGVPIEQCLYIGENLIEVIGAIGAGMKAVLKPCPPGRDLPT